MKTRVSALLFTWLCVGASLLGQEPLGVVVAWHKNFPNTPTLSPGWVEASGQVVSDPGSPYDGQTLPDLNGGGRFLRGGASSGALQDDAFQGHHHGISHAVERVIASSAWGGQGGGVANDQPASIQIANPSVGQHGVPRTADETRPTNFSVVWILNASAGSMPIGSIVAWHRDFANTRALASGWVECNGQVLNDPGSAYDGQTIPDLNAGARFLRGGTTSGVFQDDAFQGHHHAVNHNAEYVAAGGPLGSGSGVNDFSTFVNVLDPISDGTNGTPRTAIETRPRNAAVVWVMKVKPSSSPVGAILAFHRDFPNTPPLSGRHLECNGQTVADVNSAYDGQVIPDLNGSARFLRGGPSSGALQDDAFQGHRHDVSHNAERVLGTSGGYSLNPGAGIADDVSAFVTCLDPIDDGANGTPRTASETRPRNMSVVWVMTVKGPWKNLGYGLAGAAGEPLLAGKGSLVAGEPIDLELTNAAVGSAANLIIGLSSVYVPLQGGILVPSPNTIVYNLPTFGGSLTISSTWPPGLPGGVELFFQYWIADATGPAGYTASNAVSGTTQDP